MRLSIRHAYRLSIAAVAMVCLAGTGCGQVERSAPHSATATVAPTVTLTPSLPGAAHATFTRSQDIPGGIYGLAAASDGIAWGSGANAIWRFGPSTHAQRYSVDGFPYSLTVGSAKDLWFALRGSGGYAIGHIALDGSMRSVPLPAGYEISPGNVVVGPDGNLWYIATTPIFIDPQGGTFSTAFGRVTPTGSIQQFAYPHSTAGPLINTHDLAVGPDGKLWYALNQETFGQPDANHVIQEGYAGGHVGRLTLSGSFQEFALPNPRAIVSNIVNGPDGNVWFADGTTQIDQITPAGVIRTFPLPQGGESPVAGPDRNLWFFVSRPMGIERLTPTGQLTGFRPEPHLSPTGLLPEEEGNVNTLIVGADGNLWFTERPWPIIGRITPDGDITEYWPPTTGGRTISVLGQLAASPDGSIVYTMNTYGDPTLAPESGIAGRLVP